MAGSSPAMTLSVQVRTVGVKGWDQMKFGIFDHIDDAGVPLGQLYADRLTIAEAYDRAGFYGYHVAEHHTTPLGAAASPALIFAALSQRTTASCGSGRWSICCRSIIRSA